MSSHPGPALANPSRARDSVYLAVHMYPGAPPEACFTAAKRILTTHGGRPHRDKVHSRDAERLAAAYPRFEEFRWLRDRLDPDRVFGNDYLRRLLGGRRTTRGRIRCSGWVDLVKLLSSTTS